MGLDVDKSVIARLKKEGLTFEVWADCEKAIAFKQGACSLDEAVAGLIIFKDAKQGFHAGESELLKAFGTTDKRKAAEIILKKGEIQLTTEYRNKLREQRKRQIIEYLHRHAIDAKTGLPHPPQRIENAMNEARVKIDEFKPVETQIYDILTAIKDRIPIKLETREVAVKIPSQFAPKCYPALKQYKMLRQDWHTDGSFLAVLELPAGLQEELENLLNQLTKGEVDIRILSKK